MLEVMLDRHLFLFVKKLLPSAHGRSGQVLADIRKLQLEHDLLKKANELLKKGLGVDLPLLNNREKTVLVDAVR